MPCPSCQPTVLCTEIGTKKAYRRHSHDQPFTMACRKEFKSPGSISSETCLPFISQFRQVPSARLQVRIIYTAALIILLSKHIISMESERYIAE